MSQTNAEQIAVPSAAPDERISAVDVLRGVAVLGILVINIEYFALPHADKSAAGTEWVGAFAPALETRAALIGWIAVRALFEGKMRAIFSMLFGAGVVLLTGRIERRDQLAGAADVYYRRTLWLLAIGVAHAYLLWEGDILYAYALTGLCLYPLRKLSPRALITAAAIVVAISIPRAALMAHHRQELRARAASAEADEAAGRALDRAAGAARDDWRDIEETFRPDEAALAEARGDYHGGYGRLFKRRAELVAIVESSDFYGWAFFDAIAMMMMGMGLLKAGVLTGARSRRFYAALAAAGFGAGLPVAAASAYALHRYADDPVAIAWLAVVYDPARLAVALGEIALVMLMLRAGRAGWLARLLGDVGRVALTSYLGATLIATTLFNGHGLGLFGTVPRPGLYAIVGGIWCAQIAFARLWLRAFRMGPAEWVWRSLTYWKLQPLRRGVAGGPTPYAAQGHGA